MRTNNLIFILLIGLVLFSCDRDTEPNPELDKNYSIVGEWIWFSSYSGWAGSYTPESTETKLSLSFTRNDKIVIIENLDTILQTNYYISNEESYIYNEKVDFLYINCDSVLTTEPSFFVIAPPDLNRLIIRSLTDTLYLVEDAFDGSGHHFARNQNKTR
ncbi:MAG: hypothetical protein JEY96_20035 [Bacteroidales bacterium]|nr:hypothetical protein [Bacteroidales bacterium]